MIDTAQANAILREYGVTVVPAQAHLRPGQTKSVISLQKIVRARGFDHARFVVMLWRETMIRQVPMDAATMWAVSDTLKAIERNFPDLVDNRMDDLFAFFDGLPLGWMRDWVRDLDGIVPRRAAVAGMIYERVKRKFGIDQADLLDDRRRKTA